nr:radical SAM protein [Fusobacterium ulcerans]
MINSEKVWIGNIYRPPSEAYSIILQVTIGCSHNKCTFCSMYKSKKFSIKPIEKIKSEIEYFRKRVKYAERIFLADGDAMIIPTEMLLEILAYIKKVFPECKRISSYATPKSIELKTNDELRKIRESGISLLYIGLESGDDKVLEKINKGVSSDELTALCKKAKEAGFFSFSYFHSWNIRKKRLERSCCKHWEINKQDRTRLCRNPQSHAGRRNRNIY